MFDNESVNVSHEIMNRLSFHDTMMFTAVTISMMATCRRRAIGCVLVNNRQIVATGYNGAPQGMPHCLAEGCLIHEGHCIRCVHAEANATLKCTQADTAYCTDRPCLMCLRLMLQKGITKIYYWRHYTDHATDLFLTENYGGISNWPLFLISDQLSTRLQTINSEMREYTDALRIS